MRKRSITRIAIVTGIVLLLPLLAMQFSDEVTWDVVDFVIGGVLLFGAGLAYELVASRAGTVAHRIAFGLAVGATLLLIWMNLAVGLIGSEDNPANLLYLGAIVIGFVGAIIARFRPRGMARALFATAIAQALVPVMAWVIWRPQEVAPEGLVGLLWVNTFFVMLFVGSAFLFRRASVP